MHCYFDYYSDTFHFGEQKGESITKDKLECEYEDNTQKMRLPVDKTMNIGTCAANAN